MEVDRLHEIREPACGDWLLASVLAWDEHNAMCKANLWQKFEILFVDDMHKVTVIHVRRKA